MQTVNIHEAKTHLSRFVDQAAARNEFIIARAGKPLAPNEGAPRQLGLGKGRFTLPADFDAMNASDIEAMFEAGT